jgi:hypothetical protein
MLTDLVNRADAGMIQRRGRPRFPPKSLERLLVAGDVIGEKLERDEPAKLRIFGLVHHAHAATTKLFDDVVMRNGLADRWAEMLGGSLGQVNRTDRSYADSAIGLSVPSLVPHDKHVVGHGVPCVVNADEEQQQCSRRDTKHRPGWMGTSQASRCRERRIGTKRKQSMKQPILEHGLVCGLCAQASSHDQSVGNSTEAQQSPTHGCRANAIPWSA